MSSIEQNPVPHSRTPQPLRRMARVAIGLFVLGALGYGLLAFLNDALSFAGKWEGQVRSAVPSPNGRYVAEISDWNGGATTGFETRVALRRPSERDTVIGVTYSKGTVAVLLGAPVKVWWEGEQRLVISGPMSRIKDRVQSWRDVTIGYRDQQTGNNKD